MSTAICPPAEWFALALPDESAPVAAPITTRAALHNWVRDHLNASIPRWALVPGHSAPFDYLLHAYFDGDPPPDDQATPAPERPAPTSPVDCVVWAPRGGGKTFLGAVATALDLLHKPGIEVRILAGSLEQAGKMYAHLRRIFEIPALHNEVRGKITSRRITLDNDSTVELLAASEASVRGTRVQRVRCDEVELFEPSIWEAAQLTTRSERGEGGRTIPGTIECLSTMHVPHGMMARLVREAEEGKRTLFKWSLLDVLEKCTRGRCRADGTDGPLKRVRKNASTSARLPHSLPQRTDTDCPLLEECSGLAKSEVYGPVDSLIDVDRIAGHVSIADAIRMKSRVSRQTWASEVLCRRANRSHTVYGTFDPDLHVTDHEPAAGPGVALLAGMDFGYRAPTVVLWGAHDAVSNVLTIVGEHAEAELVLATHIRAILESPRGVPAWVGIDPAGNARSEQTGVSAAEVLRKAGLRVRARSLPVQQSIELVQRRLGTADGAPPRLLIHRRCTRLIEAMETYHYSEKDQASLEPVKDGPDHACDALRYLVTNLDRPNIERTWNYLK